MDWLSFKNKSIFQLETASTLGSLDSTDFEVSFLSLVFHTQLIYWGEKSETAVRAPKLGVQPAQQGFHRHLSLRGKSETLFITSEIWKTAIDWFWRRSCAKKWLPRNSWTAWTRWTRRQPPLQPPWTRTTTRQPLPGPIWSCLLVWLRSFWLQSMCSSRPRRICDQIIDWLMIALRHFHPFLSFSVSKTRLILKVPSMFPTEYILLLIMLY